MLFKEILGSAMSYQQYKNLLEDLLAHGKTTGQDQSAEYINYAKINLQRMRRLEKTIGLNEELRDGLSGISRHYTWLIITEGWCGDAAQNIPLFYCIEKEFKNIELKFILRDENPGIMDLYLTNGSRSIPKLICVDDNLNELFVWGPRPEGLQEIIMLMKKENRPREEKGLVTQNWYNADKTRSLQLEILKLVRNL